MTGYRNAFRKESVELKMEESNEKCIWLRLGVVVF
jgi:hypothetical protein